MGRFRASPLKILKMKNVFSNFGYFLEYYVDDKFVGTTIIDEPDRDEIGYYSRIDSVAEENIQLQQKNRKIRNGQSYYTRMYPLCGKKK